MYFSDTNGTEVGWLFCYWVKSWLNSMSMWSSWCRTSWRERRWSFILWPYISMPISPDLRYLIMATSLKKRYTANSSDWRTGGATKSLPISIPSHSLFGRICNLLNDYSRSSGWLEKGNKRRSKVRGFCFNIILNKILTYQNFFIYSTFWKCKQHFNKNMSQSIL